MRQIHIFTIFQNLMQMRIWLTILCVGFTTAFAQKKPLDHSVYDGWQSIGKRSVSNDGQWIVYNISVQEGDEDLVIQSAAGDQKLVIPRGAGAQITNDNRFVIAQIKPFFAETRQAKIKKKKADEMPKDSLAIVNLQTLQVTKTPRVKSFKLPEDGSGYVVYQRYEQKDTTKPAKVNREADSLQLVIDSLQQVLETRQSVKGRKRKKDGDDLLALANEEKKNAGSQLVYLDLESGTEVIFERVNVYVLNKKGGKLLFDVSKQANDSTGMNAVILFDILNQKADTISRAGNEYKHLTLSEDGRKAAFVAERDSAAKALQKFYKLWFFDQAADSATLLVDKKTPGMPKDFTVSEHASLRFSKSGDRLLLGTAPIGVPKDTTVVEMDQVKLDIWHYQDDYLQPIQLKRLNQELQRNYLAVYQLTNNRLMQLETDSIPNVYVTGDGDGKTFVGVTDIGRRTASQWQGNTLKDVYAIDAQTGRKKLIKENLNGMIYPTYISHGGKHIVWYDYTTRNYHVYDGNQIRNATANIKVALHDEENDQPNDPGPYGIMGWLNGEDQLLVYDRYDIWKVDVTGKRAPENVTDGLGRKTGKTYRYLRTDTKEDYINGQNMNLLSVFDNRTKKAGIAVYTDGRMYTDLPPQFQDAPYSIGSPDKAKNANVFIYTKENYTESPNLYVFSQNGGERKLTNINPQQEDYNWGTAELYRWKTFSGKTSTGILYKPEDFDSTKAYPVILYFYEKLSDGLYRYQPPAPTPSRLNIPFFVSRGYIVFAPDIEYTIGHPAKSAYDYIVSAAKDLSAKKWVDGKNMGIQGQSWGGIQVAQLITMTDMFKAAWAGAPVANMTSAYGGIRWASGMNRQFQYEKTQSRIGATLWEKPELYIENSPLFHVPKINTPLVIMHNDNDGAVPWYQGIELFTAMVRLNKPVWLLNYNGEEHNLMERKNRKDIQIREQQFFDWLLKGERAPRWIKEGVKAVDKGREYGLELVE